MLIESYGLTEGEKEPLTEFLDEMREFVSVKKTDAILLAEVNLAPDEMKTYLHEGRRMHMLFNFYLNQHLVVAAAKESATPLIDAIKSLPSLHDTNQWLNFLRHHDELSLKLLNAEDKDLVLKAFAPEPSMRIFKNRGIRRRLASMVDGDEQKMKLYFSLLFSLPGTPLIRYGDEIGMGEDLSLSGRASVRTAMQWSDAKNGGFSRADKPELIHPVIDKGAFGFEKVNVVAAQRDPNSFLNWIERLITVRKQCPEISFGTLQVLPVEETSLLIHSYEWKNEKLIIIHNLSLKEVSILKEKIGLGDAHFFELFCDDKIANAEAGQLTIKGYGYKWIRVG